MYAVIREAQDKDLPELARLMDQLGYPTSPDEMRLRFVQVKASADYLTLIAEDKGRVVGMIGMHRGWQYAQNGPMVRILALVVDGGHRYHGIGHLLLQHAEIWAEEIGAAVVALNSGNRVERLNAHRFYRRRGYQDKALGFYKELPLR